jgi:predicted phage-related endonuclease
MKRLNLTQGSPEWHAHRATARNASEAPAMLGCSPYMTRGELLHARHTGLRAEPDAALARRYADGHAIEAAQRQRAASVIGEALYPITGCAVVDGIELSASFDGLTMDEEVGYECKTLNDDLRAALPYSGEGSDCPNDSHGLPKHYCVQMEQQLMVCGGERILFVAATKDGSDVRCCWYYSDPALRAEILAGWRQFDADLAAYIPPAASTVEKIVAEPVEALPAVSVIVEGSLVVRENFAAFRERLTHFLEHRLIRQPKSDQDFANLEAQIKEMKAAEEALQRAEAQMIAQIQTVDQAKKTKDMLAKLVRENRLLAEKLLKDEKERRREQIVTAGRTALEDHVRALNQRLGKPYMPPVVAPFGDCIKGLKSLSSMEDKVATLLANTKILANEVADRIDANLKALRELASEHTFLFADTGTLVLKAPDDCRAQITSRIAEHRAAEEKRIEAERARIRAEEAARLEREQAQREAEARQQQEAQAQREQKEREVNDRIAAERREREEAAERLHAASEQLHDAARAEEMRHHAASVVVQGVAAMRDDAAADLLAPAANVVPMPTKAPVGPPTLMLRAINERLAPLSVTADGLRALGFEPAGRDRAAVLYHDATLPLILSAVIAHLSKARDQIAKAA